MNAAIAFLALTVAADPTPNLVTVTVEPAELTLSHPRFGHRLLVTGIDNARPSLRPDLRSRVVGAG